MFRLFVLFIFAPVLGWASSQTVACSHPQVCNLINDIAPQMQASLPEPMNGDPHLYSPSPSSIKKYLNVDVLIAAPLELNPWIEKIISMRKEQNKKSYILKRHDFSQLKVSKESLAHFWLNIDSLCDAHSQLNQFFELKVTACPYFNFKNQLESELGRWKEAVFILGHDALTTLLKLNGLTALPIEGGGHDHEIDSKSMKKLVNLTKTTQSVVWIEEPPLHFPKSVLKYKKSKDLLFKIRVDGVIGEAPTQVISDFLSELKKANP